MSKLPGNIETTISERAALTAAARAASLTISITPNNRITVLPGLQNHITTEQNLPFMYDAVSATGIATATMSIIATVKLFRDE
ncbi:hypothetical protein BPOR_0132g00110 [Botrytis porri]|uniref:Uncharacterized protein n=1 Tax=Botrytis porri TaxID=87229 RepID=A0A4Z1KWN7_9HELO|nr:hypothetical protein BPOR_0132g00110 [Botrytis porri]